MPIVVEVPDVGEVEFPDGMTDDEISSAILSNYPDLGKPPASLQAVVPAPARVTAPAPKPSKPNPEEEQRAKMEEARLLTERYRIALELSPDPIKATELTDKYHRELKRMGIGVVKDMPIGQTALGPGAHITGTLAGMVGRDTEAIQSAFPGRTGAVLAGINEAAADAVEAFTSPLGVATLGQGALPQSAQKAVSGAFAVDMARHVPGQAAEAGRLAGEGDTQGAVRAGTGAVLSSVFAAGAGKHALETRSTLPRPVQSEIEAFQKRTESGAMEFEPRAAAEPVKVDALDPVTIAAERAESNHAPATAAVLREISKPKETEMGEPVPEAPKVDALDSATVEPDLGVLGKDAPGDGVKFALELNDGTVIFGDAAAHFDLLGRLPEELQGRVVNGGFVENGKYSRGGDFSVGVKEGENALDYYGKDLSGPPEGTVKESLSVEPEAETKGVGLSEKEKGIEEKGVLEPETETDVVDVPVRQVAREQIASRPDLMQFKRMDDAQTGINAADKLEGKWDDRKAGNLLLWEPINPAEYGLQPGEKYIIANGHHRFQFGKESGIKGFNAQIVREIDGVNAEQARTLGAEINIADGKGTIYDQARFIRNEAAAHGEDAALARARQIGARGRKASTIGIHATDTLFDSFINERITPDQAEIITKTAPRDEALQRVGIQHATRGKSGAELSNLIQAIKSEAKAQTAKQVDLFGSDDAAIAQAESMAAKASARQREISEQIAAVQGAAKRPEQAAKLGVNVSDPAGILNRIAELKAERERWENWALHPDLVAEVKGQPKPQADLPTLRPGERQGDLISKQTEDFALVGEKGKDFERIAQEKAAAEKAIAEAKAKQDKEQGTFFDRRGGKSESDVFKLEEVDLLDLLEERFGEQRKSGGTPGESFGRSRGQFEFPTYEEFAKWMDERYAEADVEGMRLAFAEADTQSKVRYIKENRAGDLDKKAWISHLATGSPLPAGKPPVTRTTPRPMPGGVPPKAGGTGGTTPPRGPARPAPPPPPPRSPTPLRKFDTTALVQFLRQFGDHPRVNSRLKTSLGRFVKDGNLVEVKERLFWDTKLAEEVLGHEIGHYIDLAIDLTGDNKRFAARIDPLKEYKKKIGESAELKREARSLSRMWRGPFKDGDTYRDTAPELFADTMSAVFHNPEWVNQNFPKLHDAFERLKRGKPDFATAYNEITSWLTGDQMPSKLLEQARAAVERTQTELLKERPGKDRSSFKDWLATQFVTIWHRAAQKEGNVRDIGKTKMDALEYSKSAAAKWDALWADDFQKRVVPELEKVSADPMEGRALFHAHAQAIRTIRERRAAGQWIEQHPGEARALLEAVLDADGNLNAKFKGQLDAAGPGDFYDLGARIFREVHDRGEHFVNRIERVIDDLNLGVDGDNALMAFNVRGKLLNPGGMTPEQARAVIADLRSRLTPAQFKALESAGKELRGLVSETVRAAFDEGLISRKAWTELIEPNLDNYLPYAVLDYFDGRVRAGIMKQKGTAKDVADVIVSSQLKVAALNAWRQHQRQPVLLREMYAAGGIPLGLGERLRKASDLDAIRKRHSQDDISRAVIWEDGKPRLIEFLGDPGKTLERALDSSSMADHLSWLADAQGITHKIMSLYTTLSLPFVFFRNPSRGARTAATRGGFLRTGEQLLNPKNIGEAWQMARNYAAAAKGEVLDPKVRELIEKEGLAPPRLSATMLRDVQNLQDLVAGHAVMAWQVRNLRPEAQPKWWRGGIVGRKIYEAAENIFTSYEAFEKIYNYRAALAKGLPEEKALAVMRRAGIPKPGVGGHFSNPMEIWFPWTRIHLQGLRATFNTLRDPDLGDGFKARLAATEIAPRILKVGMATGVIGGGWAWFIGKDEDKNDPVMAEVFRRVSPYKMALDDVAPLMLHDARTGKYHFFNEYKSGASIPKHFEVVSLRIPSSEEGRLWGPLVYNLLANSPGVKEQAGKPGEDMLSAAANWAKNYLTPGISPAIETSKALFDMIGRGKNPDDPYRGQPAANPRLFDAGGLARAEAIAGYTLNQMGGPGEIAGVLAMNFGLLDERSMNAMNLRFKGENNPLAQKLPIIKSMLSYDNYAQYRADKNEGMAEDTLRARARLLMSEETQALHDFYHRNKQRQDKLDAVGKKRYEVASHFVNKTWGKMDDPNSFYSKAAHAVSADSSKDARETFKRDLHAASLHLIATFQNAHAIVEASKE